MSEHQMGGNIIPPVQQRAATEIAHELPARQHGSACVGHMSVTSVETELRTGTGGASAAPGGCVETKQHGAAPYFENRP